MGREIQKKKRRSARQPVRQPRKPKNALNPRGNAMIAKNWDKKETLSQNYRRLGLVSRLRNATGGTEKSIHSTKGSTSRTSRDDPFAITTTDKAIVSEAKVERDADGNIIRIIGHTGAKSRNNPLNDPLNALDSDEEDEEEEDAWEGVEEDEDEGEGDEKTQLLKDLEWQANNPAEKTPRHQSDREREWLEKLLEKHGDDYSRMARDHKLNPMQQTAADIKRRIKKMQK